MGEATTRKRKAPAMSEAASGLPEMISHLDVCKRMNMRPNSWRWKVQHGTLPLPALTNGFMWFYRMDDVKQWMSGKGWPAHCTFKGGPSKEVPS